MTTIDVALDTEFVDDGNTIDLVSIGLAASNGTRYYAINLDCDWDAVRAHPWMMANVVPHLPLTAAGNLNRHDPAVKPKAQIAHEVTAWFAELHPCRPRVWAYYAPYDAVALFQLWGPAMRRPPVVPFHVSCVEQYRIDTGFPEGLMPAKPRDAHHALRDAEWDLQAVTTIRAWTRRRRRAEIEAAVRDSDWHRSR